MRSYLYGNAVGLSFIAFASYFDVYSHRQIFVGTDPWWNPAHLMLYAGSAVIAYGVFRGRTRGAAGTLSIVGLVIVLSAAGFNEFWHRVFLFGNPLPEPFPVEPPHALLAVGFIVLGLGALLHPLDRPSVVSGVLERAAVAFTGGSLWLIVGGSALYVAGAYRTPEAFLFGVGASSFAASLFLVYPQAVTGRFGYSTLSYSWFMLVYYAFFLSPADGLPYGVGLVALIDFVLSKGRVAGIDSRYAVLPLVAALYGVVYYPILPAEATLAVNAGLLASGVGVSVEFLAEKAFVRSRRKAASPIAPKLGTGPE